MSACRGFRRAVQAALASGRALPEGEAKEHAAVCRKCRKESDDLRAVLSGAEAVRDEIDAAMDSVDWDGLSNRIAEAGLAEKRMREAEPETVRAVTWGAWLSRKLRWRPLLAGAAAGLVVGVLATALFLRRHPQAGTTLAAVPPAAAETGRYAASGEFLQSVELEMAKREAIHYLEESEYLLLDLLERKPAAPAVSPSPEAGSAETSWARGVAPAVSPSPEAGPAETSRTTRAARDLLARKRYFNAHLDDVRIAKARVLCDQIEILLLELARTSQALDPAEAAEIRRTVEDKQLLLQIRLLKKELRSSEV